MYGTRGLRKTAGGDWENGSSESKNEFPIRAEAKPDRILNKTYTNLPVPDAVHAEHLLFELALLLLRGREELLGVLLVRGDLRRPDDAAGRAGF